MLTPEVASEYSLRPTGGAGQGQGELSAGTLWTLGRPRCFALPLSTNRPHRPRRPTQPVLRLRAGWGARVGVAVS